MSIRGLALILPLTIAPVFLLAQDDEDKKSENLVVNGDFEEVVGKFKRLGSIEVAKGWKSPTTAKADLFSESVPGGVITVPRNQYGDQGALSGSNYAGVRWWSFQNKQPRSYLQTKFSKTLKKGQKYCVKYHVSLSDLSKYATNELGAYISKVPVNKTDDNNLTYKAQVPHLRTKIYDDMQGWQGVCGVYEASGDEQYLIIGNFAATENTLNEKPKRPKGENRPQLLHAYYYIDDVSVTPIKFARDCSCEQIEKGESEFIFGRKGVTNPGLKPAQKVDMQVFYFKRFQRAMDRSMAPWVQEMAELMAEDPAIRVRLVGHMDEVEKERARMRPDLEELATERAESLKEALVEAGVEASRIDTAGAGAESLADQTGTEVGMSKNRRVEVEVVK